MVLSNEMKRKTYKERCNFILSLFNNLHIYYPVTPGCDEVIEAYAKFTGFKVDKLGRCNQLSRDFTRCIKRSFLYDFLLVMIVIPEMENQNGVIFMIYPKTNITTNATYCTKNKLDNCKF